jgi:hypothetical protein
MRFSTDASSFILVTSTDDSGPDAAGRAFPAYPHLGISLWIIESASHKAFLMADDISCRKFKELDEEGPCG